MEYKLKNVLLRFNDSEKSILVIDLNDHANGTACYNTRKRGYAKCKELFTTLAELGDTCTLSVYRRIADEKFNLRMHAWCMVD